MIKQKIKRFVATSMIRIRASVLLVYMNNMLILFFFLNIFAKHTTEFKLPKCLYLKRKRKKREKEGKTLHQNIGKVQHNAHQVDYVVNSA